MPSVRLLIAAGHEVLRIGVRILLENNPDWKVVGEANDGQQAIERANELRPDIAILDCSTPGSNWMDAAGKIVKSLPGTKVLTLAIHDGDILIEEMQRAGAHGCLRKADVSRDLISAIKTLSQNKAFYPQRLTSMTHRGSKTGDQRPLPSDGPPERDCQVVS